MREETGYIARDQYRIAVLFQPGKPWTASAPQPQFNHKLVITHGASCDTSYETGSAPDVRNRTALGAGFVVMSHALNNAGHNCNIITQAESMVMTKERVIERYGELRYTIGSGCSGGSLVQQQVANAYPGLYQGITPQCSFTDAWSSAMQYVDYVGLLRLLRGPDAAGSRARCGTRSRSPRSSTTRTRPTRSRSPSVIANSGDPSRSCPGVPAEDVYDPATNPGGVKCTLQDYMVNVFGKRPDGFANRAIGNTGIQYGLEGLAERADHRRSSSSTSTRRSAGSATTATRPRTGARPTSSACERRLPHRRGQLGEQPRQGRDHRPARPRPRRLPRRVPHLRDA